MNRLAVPEYRRAADEIKTMITAGRIRDGIKVPEIEKMTGTTYPTARRVAKELEAEGILRAHPGKGYAVVAMPDEAAAGRADASEIRKQVALLRDEVRALSARLGADGDIGATLERIDSDVEDLFDKLGYTRTGPSGERRDEPPAARHGHVG